MHNCKVRHNDGERDPERGDRFDLQANPSVGGNVCKEGSSIFIDQMLEFLNHGLFSLIGSNCNEILKSSGEERIIRRATHSIQT